MFSTLVAVLSFEQILSSSSAVTGENILQLTIMVNRIVRENVSVCFI